MVHSKNEMLLGAMHKCRIWIPLEILLLLDLKISKIEPEMAELALSIGYFFHNRRHLFRNAFGLGRASYLELFSYAMFLPPTMNNNKRRGEGEGETERERERER